MAEVEADQLKQAIGGPFARDDVRVDLPSANPERMIKRKSEFSSFV
jgi:hypothetical protein